MCRSESQALPTYYEILDRYAGNLTAFVSYLCRQAITEVFDDDLSLYAYI